MKEREIKLTEVFFDIMLHWRGIIVWMLIGAVLLGVFSYINSSRKVQNQKTQLQEMQQMQQMNNDMPTQQWLEEQMTDSQIAFVKMVIRSEENYENKIAYGKKSAILNMNPSSIIRGEISYLINAESMEQACNIEKIYEDQATSVGLMEILAEKCEMTTAEVWELVSLEASSYSVQEGSNLLRIYVLNGDEPTCREMIKVIHEYLSKLRQNLIETVGEHELVVLDESFAEVTSSSILTRQRSYQDEVSNLEKSIADMKEKFTEEQKNYYVILTKGSLEDEGEKKNSNVEVEQPQIATVGVSPKYVVLGMLLFAFIYAALIFVKIVFNNKFLDTDDLNTLFDVQQLGRIPEKEQSKRIFRFVDQWLISLRDRNVRKFSWEESIKLISASVKITAVKNNIEPIYFIGCNMSEMTVEACQQIQKKLKEDGVAVHILNNILYDAEAMEQLSNAKGVVLVEQAGKTLYQEIVKERNLCLNQNILVLGGIVKE